ncbi:MAG: hypothetical protein M3Q68_01415, partial [Actinomycetota bacterium]|nr:hypothetical protein [Actinomycetota bacterium]
TQASSKPWWMPSTASRPPCTSALQCILAQRLARRLCDRCKVPVIPKPDVLSRLGWNDADRDRDGAGFFAAVGCRMCGDSGYLGRFAIHEVMPVSDRVADAIPNGRRRRRSNPSPSRTAC